MVNPPPAWASSYESIFKDTFKKVDQKQIDGVTGVAQAWAKWVNDNGKGIQGVVPTAAPLTISGTTNQAAFAPVVFAVPGVPPAAAAVLATAWQAWAMSIVWPVPPPAPPFSAILSVTTNPATAAAAYATLLAGLIAEFAVVPPGPAGLPAKYMNLGTLFSTATKSMGILVTGLSLPSPTPVPLVLPGTTL